MNCQDFNENTLSRGIRKQNVWPVLYTKVLDLLINDKYKNRTNFLVSGTLIVYYKLVGWNHLSYEMRCLRDKQEVTIAKGSHYLGRGCSIHVAEYTALVMGMESALQCGVRHLTIMCDSQHVFNQVRHEPQQLNFFQYQKADKKTCTHPTGNRKVECMPFEHSRSQTSCRRITERIWNLRSALHSPQVQYRGPMPRWESYCQLFRQHPCCKVSFISMFCFCRWGKNSSLLWWKVTTCILSKQ